MANSNLNIDHPILFSAPMVRALLDGRKTQTRRVLTPRNTKSFSAGPLKKTWDRFDWDDAFVDPGPSPAGNAGPYLKVARPDDGTRHRVYPIYQPDERLWVRETHYLTDNGHNEYVVFAADEDAVQRHLAAVKVMAADPAFSENWRDHARKRPAIHMPRWASRLTLVVMDVRLERLQTIGQDDALAEGVQQESADPPFYYVPGIYPHSNTAVGVEEPGGRHAERSYAKLWDHLNGPGAWENNPWVIVLTFTVERRNIDAESPT